MFPGVHTATTTIRVKILSRQISIGNKDENFNGYFPHLVYCLCDGLGHYRLMAFILMLSCRKNYKDES